MLTPITLPTDEPIALLRYRTGQPAARASLLLRQHLFTFLLAGEKTVQFAGARVTVRPHQFVLLAAGNCLMSEKATAGIDYHSLLLFFDSKLLADFCERHNALLEGLPPAEAQPFLLLSQDEFLRNFAASLGYLLGGAGAVPRELLQLKLEELLLYLALHYPQQLRQIRALGYETADELLLRRAVTAHADGGATVEELAFLCHMSLSTFKRRFARLYGSSPSRWLLARRLERAARLLRQEGRRASEIYGELGYENLSSFIQSFKQAYGQTPRQYQLTA